MILPNNPRVDVHQLQEAVQQLRTTAYRETIAPVAPREALPDGFAPPEGAVPMPSPTREFIKKIPVLGPVAAIMFRKVRRLMQPGLSWRERLRALPLIGPVMHFFWAGAQLSRFRDETAMAMDFLRTQQAQMQSTIQQVAQAPREADARESLFQQLHQRVQLLETRLTIQTRAIRLLEQQLQRCAIPSAGPGAGPEKASLGSFYVEFEDRFRGARDDIKSRLRTYLPQVREVLAASVQARCVDIGCGRGEWLELLREQGIEAQGIDLDAGMLEQSREHGLQVQQANGINWLEQQPPASLDLITAFQVIEHLSFDQFVRLLDACLHALAPHGLVIFETPNPENLQVAAHTFHLDPSHHHPIPPAFAQFLAEQRGFADAQILRLNPFPEQLQIQGGGDLPRKMNQMFYGPQDYALLARKQHG